MSAVVIPWAASHNCSFGLTLIFARFTWPVSKGLDATESTGDDTPLPHVFVPVTEILPLKAEFEKFTVMELVPAPDAMTTPGGTVHWYPVANDMGLTE